VKGRTRTGPQRGHTLLRLGLEMTSRRDSGASHCCPDARIRERGGLVERGREERRRPRLSLPTRVSPGEDKTSKARGHGFVSLAGMMNWIRVCEPGNGPRFKKKTGKIDVELT